MANRMRFQLAIALAAFIILTPSPSAHAKRESGGVVAPSAVLGFGVRPAAMGNAFVAVSDDATSIFWNPAALEINPRRELFGQYSQTYFDNTSYNMGAYKQPLGRLGAVGLGFIYEGVADIVRRDVNANNTGTFGASKMNLMMGYGKTLTHGLYIGASAHYIRQQIAEYAGSGIGMDAAALYRLTNRLSLGLNVQNLIRPTIKLKTVADKLPTNVKIGAAYNLTNWLRFALDLDMPSKASHRLHSGMEWRPIQWLMFRAGLDHAVPTLGIGFRFNDIKFDYAYRRSRELENDFQRVSFAFEFGKARSGSAFERKKYPAGLRQWQGPKSLVPITPPPVPAHPELMVRQAHHERQHDTAITSVVVNGIAKPPSADSAPAEKPVALSPDDTVPASGRDHDQLLVDELLAGGDRYLSEGRPFDALSIFQVAQDVQPENALIRRRISEALTAISKQVDDWLTQARTEMARGRSSAAQVFYDAVQKTDPQNTAAAEALTLIQTTHERQVAGPVARKPSRFDGLMARAGAMVRKAKLALKRNRTELAISRFKNALDLYRKILKMDSRHAAARKAVRQIQSDIRRYERRLAENEYLQVKQYIYSGLGHYRAGRLNEAIADWDRAVAIDSTSAAARELLKQARQKMLSAKIL